MFLNVLLYSLGAIPVMSLAKARVKASGDPYWYLKARSMIFSFFNNKSDPASASRRRWTYLVERVTGDQPEDTLEVPAGLESRIGDILHRKGVAEVILNVVRWPG
jgi:hypothetical protein